MRASSCRLLLLVKLSTDYRILAERVACKGYPGCPRSSATAAAEVGIEKHDAWCLSSCKPLLRVGLGLSCPRPCQLVLISFCSSALRSECTVIVRTWALKTSLLREL